MKKILRTLKNTYKKQWKNRSINIRQIKKMIEFFILKGINYYIFKIVNNKGIKRFKKFKGLKTLQKYY